jgi:hypothetical protein
VTVVPLRYRVDENLRGPLWNALQRARLSDGSPVNAICVGDDDAPPLSTLDPELLLWAERHDRILVSRDKRSLPQYLDDHPIVIEYLLLAAECSELQEWRNRIQYLPD